MNQFEVKVKYKKIDERTGKEVTAKETYLVSAVSFGYAEAQIYKEMEAVISGEFAIVGISIANYSDVLDQLTGDKWYKGKIQFISIDEAAGREKKIQNVMLIPADNVDEANERIKDALKPMIVDYEIVSIAESPIVDVFLKDVITDVEFEDEN